MSFRIPDFPVLKSPLNLSQTLSEAIADRYTRANAVKQEKLNPYVSDTARADLAKKILENEWYGKDKASEIGLRGATGRHYAEEDTNSRYKREHGLLESDFIQGMHYLDSLDKGNINKPVTSGNIINSNVPQDTDNMTRHDLVSRANADQAAYDQRNNISPNQSSSYNYTPADPQQQIVSELAQRLGMGKPSVTMENPVAPLVAERMQQNAPQQQEQMVPGTNISIKEAREALAKKFLGMGTSDPATQKYHEGMLELAQRREKASYFKALPQDARDADISVVAPMVGGFTTAARELMSGKTPEEIAASKGYDPKDRATWPTPSPPPSKVVITQIQKGNIARNAREAIHERITNNLGFYPDKVLGYSPKMIADLLQGKNAEQAGKTLAAVFMNNEENALMARGMGVQAGLGMIKMMNNKSLNDLGVPGFLQSKELLDSFRKEVRNYNNVMVGNENNTLNQIYRLKNSVNTSSANEGTSEGKTTIIDSNGMEHTIDSNNLDAARERDPGLQVKT